MDMQLDYKFKPLQLVFSSFHFRKITGQLIPFYTKVQNEEIWHLPKRFIALTLHHYMCKEERIVLKQLH